MSSLDPTSRCSAVSSRAPRTLRFTVTASIASWPGTKPANQACSRTGTRVSSRGGTLNSSSRRVSQRAGSTWPGSTTLAPARRSGSSSSRDWVSTAMAVGRVSGSWRSLRTKDTASCTSAAARTTSLGARERTASNPVWGSPAKARSTPLLHRTVRPSSEVRSDGATIRTAGTGCP